jgi:hypothetical protein
MTDKNFPHAVLTSLLNETPTRYTLKTLHIQLNANAISVPSNRGNGLLGHLALVVPPGEYLTASNNIPFEPPINPGPAPTHVANPTQMQITETNRQYLADFKEFSTYVNTEAALKKLLIAAVPAPYIDVISSELYGFASVTTLQILNHLDSTYGTLTMDDLDYNTTLMNQEWNPTTQPLEDLFEQVRKCQAFVQDTDPISDSIAMRSILRNLEKTGLFPEVIKDFRTLPIVDQTMQQLKTNFILANRERKRHQTTATAGYHTAAAALKISTKPPSATNSFYCWSHGLGPNSEHTSKSCKFPSPGHKEYATVDNMLGGCNTIHRKRNEVSVFIRTVKTKPTNTANSLSTISQPSENSN